MTPAKRGDLVVVHRVTRNYAIGQASTIHDQFDVMEVIGLFRDGRIRAVRSVDGTYAETLDRILGYQRCWVASTDRIDKLAAIEAVKAHHWPGHPGQLKSFDSFAEARAAIVPRFRADLERES
jgi:hypothetical protein